MFVIIKKLRKLLEKYDIDYGLVFTALAFVQLYFIFKLPSFSLVKTITMVFALSPIWLPLLTISLAFWQWMEYVTKAFRLSAGRTTLRIKLPPEVFKSPEAMEIVLTQIWNKQSPDNLFQTYVQGKHPQQYSFEIVSIGGDVRFYANVSTKKTKDAIEAALYGQYPGVEVVEEPVDYAAEFERDLDKWEVFTHQFHKKKPGHFPIKTYIDYGLDKLPKEEEKVDPLTPMLEFLGTKVKPHERVCIQIVAIPYRESEFANGQPFGSGRKWIEDAKEAVDEIMQRDPKTKASISKEGSDFDGSPRITSGERDTIEAMERNIEKYAYMAAIRWLYLAPKGQFNVDIISPVNRLFSQYDLNDRNGLGVAWRTDFNYFMFADPFGTKLNAVRIQELKEYKLRKINPKSSALRYEIFTVEELATMFHLPGKVALTPTLGRIESTRATAPSNLPTVPEN